MGISGVRITASNPKANAEPVNITQELETPHREDKEDWYTKTNEAQRIVFERFSPVKIRTQQQAEPKAWQLQIGMPTLAQMEMEIEYSKSVPPSYGLTPDIVKGLFTLVPESMAVRETRNPFLTFLNYYLNKGSPRSFQRDHILSYEIL